MIRQRRPFGVLSPSISPRVAGRGVLASLLIGFLALSAGARAQSIWHVDDDATLGGDGTSWGTAFRHLQDALAVAAGGDEIRVAGGTYRPDQDEAGVVTPGDRDTAFGLIDGTGLFGGYRGCPGETCSGGDPDERNPVAYATILSGDLAGDDLVDPGLVLPCFSGPDVDYAFGCAEFDLDGDGDVDCADLGMTENSHHVMSAQTGDSVMTVDGFTITRGNSYGVGSGGGLEMSWTVTVEVRDCRFQWNLANGGGAVFGGLGHVTDCLFLENLAFYGGAMQNGLRPVNCEFRRNRGTQGGALWVGGGVPLVDHCRFAENYSSNVGGAIYVHGTTTQAVIVDCDFTANTVVAHGGAINNRGPTQLDVLSCRFLGNRSESGYGGGVYSRESTAFILNSVFVGNTSSVAGGAYFSSDDGSHTSITNCTFLANGEDQVAFGYSSQGGIRNSILWGGSQQIVLYSNQEQPLIASCNIQGCGGSGAGWDALLGIDGGGNIDAEPAFLDPDGPDDEPGTLDDNLRLDTSSPCIDAGDSSTLPADSFDLDGDGDIAETLPTDLDGLARVISSSVDMGPYEYSDCNSNGVSDWVDVQTGDCNSNLIPDECDPDADGDGIPDDCDACTDSDGDGFGDPGYPNNTCADDNCPNDPNPDQLDSDLDGAGDLCDLCPGHDDTVDADEDGIPDGCDDCTDTDGDGYGDPGYPANMCPVDTCPGFDDGVDTDEDGYPDGCDTCPRDHNPGQGADCELPPHVLAVRADAYGMEDGTDWFNAYTSVQDALAAASASGGTITEIWVAAGTYRPDEGAGITPGDRAATFSLVSGVSLYGGFEGWEGDSALRDPTTHATILSGDLAGDDLVDPGLVLPCFSGPDVDYAFGCAEFDLDGDGDVDCADLGMTENSHHVMSAQIGDSLMTVDGFTIARGNSYDVGSGGGLEMSWTVTVEVRDCRFQWNLANGGGAVFGGLGHVTDCLFLENLAFYGGAMQNGLRPVNCEFRRNRGTQGGALWVGGGVPLVDGCRFTENYSSSIGGAIYVHGTTTQAVIVDCDFTANTVVVNGGAINNRGPTRLDVLSCRFLGNRSESGNGGGVYSRESNAFILNSIFVGNTSSGAGGAYFSSDDESHTSITNCTFLANGEDHVAFGYSSQGVIRNSILWGGSQQIVLPGNQEQPLIASCNIQGCGGSGAGWDALLGIDGGGNIDIDPLLTPNGWLMAGSPCVDAGDNTLVPTDEFDLDGDEDTTEPLPLDVNSDVRFVDDPLADDTGAGTAPIVDIGADEFLDADGDGLPDWWENAAGLNPILADSDDDMTPDPEEDLGGDSLSNLEEYALYGSNPTAAPYHVNGTVGDDAFDGAAATPQGGSVGPKRTIQAGIDQAADGDTVLVAPGSYIGPGNTDLDYGGKSVVVFATDGPTATAIDSEGTGRPVNGTSIEGTFAVLEGFTLTGGDADHGGGLRADLSRLMLRDCVVAGNSAAVDAGGLYAEFADLTFVDLAIESNTAPGDAIDGGVITDSNVNLRGTLALTAGTTEARSSTFFGPGQINLNTDADPDTTLLITGETVIRTDVGGTGRMHIGSGAQLRIEGSDTVVDLSGETGGGCADPAESENWGTILVDGTLLVRDATIQNTNVEVTLADFEGAVGVVNNDITLLEASAGFGGQFFIEGAASIRCNHITSYGDRYLDLDPDPSIPPAERPTVEENKIDVIITQGVGLDRGEILELRGVDHDCSTNGVNPDCESGAYHAPGSTGFTLDPSANWVLESLEIEPGAKLNLTNRQGFVYQDPGLTTPEAVYVKHLILREDATLNTALQTLYYDQLTVETGAEIIDVPLLGFSLKIIAMEDDEEFAIRIRQRLRDPADEQPADPPPYKEGSITREEGLDPTDPANGLMVMRTQAVGQLSATSVSAKGAFARAGDEEIVVAFRYQFGQNPDAELIVYLSDDPEVSESLVELARINPPATGPGSIGSDEWALFYGTFPRGQLNFTRGTYVELELRGQDAIVWIDDFDPQIRCPSQCGDFAPPDGLDTEDFLVLLGEYGRSIDPFGADSQKWCLDSRISSDQYLDLSDVFVWDTFLNGDQLNACGTGSGGGSPAAAPPRAGAPTALPMATALIVAGKSGVAAEQRDYLYAVKPDGTALGDALDPASASDPEAGFRSNARLIQDGDGRVYQLHGTQGLIRLDTAQVVIPPSSFTVGIDEVHVGVTSIGDDDFTGLPLLDVAFHPTNPNVAYVVPVLVIPEDTNPDAAICPYKAAVKLSLTEQPGGEYTVDLLKVYGTNPAEDGCVNVTPVLGCEFILREPDVQRVREIEIDASGQNVLVLSAQGLADNNDWLLVFDESTGDELRISASGMYPGPTETTCPAATGGGAPLPASPTALMLSACGDQLYLTSSLANADPQDARTQVSAFDLQRTGDRITGLTLNRTIDIDANSVTGPDYGWGHIATVTALAEDPSTCSLFVTGFTAPRVDPYLSTDDPLYEQLFGNSASIFTTPTLAIVPTGQTTATATELQCHDLALPISATWSAHEPGDCNGDGAVDLNDYASLYSCLAGPAVEMAAGCECFDLDTDNRVGLKDYGLLQSALLTP